MIVYTDLGGDISGVPDILLHRLREWSEGDLEPGECREHSFLPIVVGQVSLPLVCQTQQQSHRFRKTLREEYTQEE